MGQDADGEKVLGVLLIIAAVILFLMWLSQFLLKMSIFLFIVGLILLAFESYFEEIKISPFILLGAVLTFIFAVSLGQFTTYLAGTAIGQASLETASAINQAEDSINQAYLDVINEQCKVMNEEQCNLIKTYAKTAKTLQDLDNYILKLRKVNEALESTKK